MNIQPRWTASPATALVPFVTDINGRAEAVWPLVGPELDHDSVERWDQFMAKNPPGRWRKCNLVVSSYGTVDLDVAQKLRFRVAEMRYRGVETESIAFNVASGATFPAIAAGTRWVNGVVSIHGPVLQEGYDAGDGRGTNVCREWMASQYFRASRSYRSDLQAIIGRMVATTAFTHLNPRDVTELGLAEHHGVPARLHDVVTQMRPHFMVPLVGDHEMVD